MTVLVTGGAGFVGAYVVRDLVAAGRSAVVYDASPFGNALDLVMLDEESGDVPREQGQITDPWRLLRVAERHDVTHVVHLASPLTQDVNLNTPSGVSDICVGTANVFETARALGVRRVVWASSIAIFGRPSLYPPGPIGNDAFHAPDSLYGSCKSLCEKMAVQYFERDGIESIGLRLTVVYGAGRLRGYMTYPSDIIRRVSLGQPVNVPFGDQPINWQYVEDVAQMFIKSLDAPGSMAASYNTWGEVETFRRVAGLLNQLVPDAQITVRSGKFDDAEDRTDAPVAFDHAPLRDEVGFEPRFPLDRGLRTTLEHYRELVRRGADAEPADGFAEEA